MASVMRDLSGFVLLFLVVLGVVTGGTTAVASPNIIVIGDQSGSDAMPLDGPVYRNAVNSLSDQLHAARLKVYDKSVLNGAVTHRGGMTHFEADIVALMRGLKRPPIDVVVIFAVHATAEKFTYTTNLLTRVTAKLLDVHTGQRLGRVEITSPEPLRVPAACTRTCLAEILGEDAGRVSAELGAQVSKRLLEMAGISAPQQPPSSGGGMPTAYTIVFAGFDPAEISEIEEYLVVFSGYRHHRPVSASFGHHEFWYESAISSGRLNRNLNKMLEYLEMPGRVSLSANVFTVERDNATPDRRVSWDDW